MRQYDRKIDKLYDQLTTGERVDAVWQLAHESFVKMNKGEDHDHLLAQIEKIKNGTPSSELWDYNQLFCQKLLNYTQEAMEELIHLVDLQRRAETLQLVRRMWLQSLYTAVLELSVKMANGHDSEELRKVTLLNPLPMLANPSVMPEEWRDDPELFCFLLLGRTLEEMEIDNLAPEKQQKYETLAKELDTLRNAGDEGRMGGCLERRRSLLPISASFSATFWTKLYEVEEKMLKELVDKAKPYDSDFAAKLQETPLSPEFVEELILFLTERRYGVKRSLEASG